MEGGVAVLFFFQMKTSIEKENCIFGAIAKLFDAEKTAHIDF